MDKDSSSIDCRGLACPEPVLRTKMALDALGAQGVVTVLVDVESSRENVKRFAESQGASVSIGEAPSGGWELTIVRGYPCEPPAPWTQAPQAGAFAFLVLSDSVGPEPELGQVLMRALLGTLVKADRKPKRLLFLNRGIHLTTEGSAVLDVLGELDAAGVEVLSCGTCLDYFKKKDLLKVGRISNMFETLEILGGPEKIVTIS